MKKKLHKVLAPRCWLYVSPKKECSRPPGFDIEQCQDVIDDTRQWPAGKAMQRKGPTSGTLRQLPPPPPGIIDQLTNIGGSSFGKEILRPREMEDSRKKMVYVFI